MCLIFNEECSLILLCCQIMHVVDIILCVRSKTNRPRSSSVLGECNLSFDFDTGEVSF